MGSIMRVSKRREAACCCALALGIAACSGNAATRGNGNGSGANSNAGATTTNLPGGGNGAGAGIGVTPGGGDGAGGANAGASSSAGTSAAPPGIDPTTLIPARIRRLTNAEFDASAQAVTGTSQTPAQNFAPDARQDGYTLDDASRIDNVTAKQIYAAATSIASSLDVAQVAPCTDMSASDACAKSFIASYGAKAYRRALSDEEASGLFGVYQTGADGATYADGIQLVVRALLNSAGFLYLTELGSATEVTSGSAISLTPEEIANSLSYLITAAPPSDALLSDARAGKLATPAGREAAFWDLIASPVARNRVVRVVEEWLGVDLIVDTDKDTTVYPKFAALKPSIANESADFITQVIRNSDSIGELLSAQSSVADAPLSAFYAANGAAPRKGILNQAAFLATFAHAQESAPVLRGVDVGRRVACLNIASPFELNIVVTAPAADSSKTTRQRFDIHASDPKCAACHATIDSFGFAFEQFDGMGDFRNGVENGLPVDSTTTIAAGTDFDGPYADSNALAVALSTSAQVRECFARNVFRASAGRSDTTVQAAENAFVTYWKSLPLADANDPKSTPQDKILLTLLAFVKSPNFNYRSAP